MCQSLRLIHDIWFCIWNICVPSAASIVFSREATMQIIHHSSKNVESHHRIVHTENRCQSDIARCMLDVSIENASGDVSTIQMCRIQHTILQHNENVWRHDPRRETWNEKKKKRKKSVYMRKYFSKIAIEFFFINVKSIHLYLNRCGRLAQKVHRLNSFCYLRASCTMLVERLNIWANRPYLLRH